MKGYRKVLIALNGNRDVLTQGLKLAGDEKCWVTVVKVLPSYEGDINLTGIKNIEDALSSNSGAAASGIKTDAAETRALVKVRVEEGDIPSAITEAAAQERCDVIVMGAPRRTGWRRLFGDNVVEKVIGMAPCPVLVVGA